MDFFAHLLWTFIFFYQPDILLFLIMELFGVLPDLVPFMPYTLHEMSNKNRHPTIEESKKVLLEAPKWVFTLYDLSHSYVIFGICFLFIYIFFEKWALILLPWALHIFFDIFTHRKPKDVFQPKFLYPISQFSFHGYSWQNRKSLIINYTLIGIGIILRIFYIKCYFPDFNNLNFY